MIYGAGMLELGMTLSLEQLIIDNDIIDAINSTVKGISVTNETIALDTIIKVGAANNFLGDKTTRDNINLVSNPMLFDRDMYGDWERSGSKDIQRVAHEKVEDILKNYEVMPIDKDVIKEMQDIVKRADKELK